MFSGHCCLWELGLRKTRMLLIGDIIGMKSSWSEHPCVYLYVYTCEVGFRVTIWWLVKLVAFGFVNLFLLFLSQVHLLQQEKAEPAVPPAKIAALTVALGL